MKVKNLSTRDSVLVLWRTGSVVPASVILSPGSGLCFDDDVEILGTYKLVQVTKLVDDPTVIEVTDE